MLDADTRSSHRQDAGVERIWSVVRGMWPWEIIAESPEQFTAALDGAHSACARIEGDDEQAIRDAVAALHESSLKQWALVVGIGGLPVRDVAALARDHDLYLLDPRSGNLVALRSSNPNVVATFLSSGWTHTKDALLVNAPGVIGRA